MSRLTGADAYGLMEAYQAVYAPQELTEEQVWEEVETWVNSLLEEGYDLSDYTWEEMYESYLSEIYQTKPLPTTTQQQSGTRKALEGGRVVSVASNLGGLRSGTTVKMDSAATRAGGRTVLRANTQQGADAPEKSIKLGGSSYDRLTTKDGVRYIERKTPTKAPVADTGGNDGGAGDGGGNDGGNKPPKGDVIVKASKGGVPGSLNKTTGKWTSSDGGKVAPATPKPSLGPTGKPLVGGIERRTPTRAEMDAAKAYRTPAATTGTLGAATAAATTKPNAFGSSTSAATPAPKPAATPVPAATPAATPAAKPVVKRDPNLGLNARERMRQNQSFDYFDVVKGHLIDEGYADTEEAALVIMANMSEEWRESIVEGMFDFLPKSTTVISNKEDKRNLLQKYSNYVKPLFAGLPKTRTVIEKPQPRGREFTNPPS